MKNSAQLPFASRRGLLAASCAVVLLSACASFKGIDTSTRLQQPGDYATAASLPDQHGQWPDASWAQTIGGASLQTLIDEAIAGNPNLQIAAARVAAARAVTEAAGAASSPAWSANFKSTYQRFSENYIIPPPFAGSYQSDNSLTLNFSYDFDFWGRHAAELRSALSQDKAAQAEQYNARLVIATSVAHAWIQLARLYAQLDLNQQQLEVSGRIAHLTQLRFNAGLDAKSESQQTRQQVASLGAEREQLQEQIVLTRNQLAALLGQGPDRGRQIERPTLPADVATALPDALPLALLGRRPDIVAARWQVEAADGGIAAARTTFYPNVNLMAFAGFSSIGLNNLLQSGSRVVGIGPAISVPILEGRTLRANLKGRVAEYDGMVATYNRALTDALHDVADQVTSLRAVALQSEQQQRATQAAAGNLDLAQQRERVGTTNMLPALSAQMTLLAQQRMDLDLQARRNDLRVGLIKALGGGFDAQSQDLAKENSISLNVPTPVRSAS
ncbi:efflux transporter outer membrane subunit [Herminiimonas fonticola]|uniref:efflux transporter outer membrane subunit n=1 Tax=Herminiimonas fonticola TaxID=303380 RepID=UPI003341258F